MWEEELARWRVGDPSCDNVMVLDAVDDDVIMEWAVINRVPPDDDDDVDNDISCADKASVNHDSRFDYCVNGVGMQDWNVAVRTDRDLKSDGDDDRRKCSEEDITISGMVRVWMIRCFMGY